MFVRLFFQESYIQLLFIAPGNLTTKREMSKQLKILHTIIDLKQENSDIVRFSNIENNSSTCFILFVMKMRRKKHNKITYFWAHSYVYIEKCVYLIEFANDDRLIQIFDLLDLSVKLNQTKFAVVKVLVLDWFTVRRNNLLRNYCEWLVASS